MLYVCFLGQYQGLNSSFYINFPIPWGYILIRRMAPSGLLNAAPQWMIKTENCSTSLADEPAPSAVRIPLQAQLLASTL
jgi:hypothetical protein